MRVADLEAQSHAVGVGNGRIGLNPLSEAAQPGRQRGLVHVLLFLGHGRMRDGSFHVANDP